MSSIKTTNEVVQIIANAGIIVALVLGLYQIYQIKYDSERNAKLDTYRFITEMVDDSYMGF